MKQSKNNQRIKLSWIHYSSETGSEVRDNLIGWTYDNFKDIECATNVAMTQRRIELKEFLQEMQDERTPGDEITLFILCKMYRRHAFVYTKKWWWSSLLFTLPAKEEDLIAKCHRVLVFIQPGVFGEIKKIRSPDLPLRQQSNRSSSRDRSNTQMLDNAVPAGHQGAEYAHRHIQNLQWTTRNWQMVKQLMSRRHHQKGIDLMLVYVNQVVLGLLHKRKSAMQDFAPHPNQRESLPHL